MEIKYYVVHASLVRCSLEDLMKPDGSFIENKMFFLKDIATQKFKATYKIISANHEVKDALQRASDKYMKKEIETLLACNLIFKLAETKKSLDFSFKIYLKTAVEFDLFDGKYLKMNSIYYIMNEHGSPLGPTYLCSENSPELLREQMEKGLILVPTKKQLFEPIQLAKAS